MLSVDQLMLALTHGAYLSAALTVVILGTLFYDPESWLNDYPPDIREAFGPMSSRAKRHQRIGGLFFATILIGGLGLSLRELSRAGEVGLSEFGGVFWHVFWVLTTFNLVDLLLIDLYLVWRLPKRFVLPGTEGLAGYSDYLFHVRGFLIGLVGAALVAVVTAAIAWAASGSA